MSKYRGGRSNYRHCSCCCLPGACSHVVQCAGPSMIPTFNQSGDVIFTEMVSPKTGRLDRGDVVIAVPPQNPKLRVCKRIIGLVSHACRCHIERLELPRYLRKERSVLYFRHTIHVQRLRVCSKWLCLCGLVPSRPTKERFWLVSLSNFGRFATLQYLLRHSSACYKEQTSRVFGTRRRYERIAFFLL